MCILFFKEEGFVSWSSVDQTSPQYLYVLLLLFDTLMCFVLTCLELKKDNFLSLSLTKFVEAGVLGCGAQYSLAHLAFSLSPILFAACFRQLFSSFGLQTGTNN